VVARAVLRCWRTCTITARRSDLAFQVVDDILDVTADSSTLGKTAGKDADNNKPTYVSLMGLEQAAALAQELLALGFGGAAAQRPGRHPRPARTGSDGGRA
jgi:farnesyl diphosphate synthase